MKLIFEKDLTNPNYYEINDGWVNYNNGSNETQCKNLCLNDSTCVFVIHFYRGQVNNSDSSTYDRKPLKNAPNNTCVLRSQLRLDYGTQKDSSSNIHYLIGSF